MVKGSDSEPRRVKAARFDGKRIGFVKSRWERRQERSFAFRWSRGEFLFRLGRW